MHRLVLVMSCVAAGVVVTAASPDTSLSLSAVLQRAGERVEQFFTRAQSLLCLEIVQLQPLNAGWGSEGFARTVESELRLSWSPEPDGTPATEAQTLRQLLRVNGHQPRKNDSRSCTTPEQQAEEQQPLSLLLPAQRSDYAFTMAGIEDVDRRRAIMIDYRLLRKPTAVSKMVDGRDDCISFDIDGGMRGRLWIDAETHDVLRLDQRLSGMVEIPLPREARRTALRSWTMERWDTSIRFKRVTFNNPEETLMLPDSLSSIQIVRGAGTPRLRTSIQYRNYQRFLTTGRIVGE
jgi:hypothetical protein